MNGDLDSDQLKKLFSACQRKWQNKMSINRQATEYFASVCVQACVNYDGEAGCQSGDIKEIIEKILRGATYCFAHSTGCQTLQSITPIPSMRNG